MLETISYLIAITNDLLFKNKCKSKLIQYFFTRNQGNEFSMWITGMPIFFHLGVDLSFENFSTSFQWSLEGTVYDCISRVMSFNSTHFENEIDVRFFLMFFIWQSMSNHPPICSKYLHLWKFLPYPGICHNSFFAELEDCHSHPY